MFKVSSHAHINTLTHTNFSLINHFTIQNTVCLSEILTGFRWKQRRIKNYFFHLFSWFYFFWNAFLLCVEVDQSIVENSKTFTSVIHQNFSANRNLNEQQNALLCYKP